MMVRIGPKNPVTGSSSAGKSGKTSGPSKRIINTPSSEVSTSVHNETPLEGELIVKPVNKAFGYLQDQTQNLMHDRRRTPDRRKQRADKPYLDVRTGRGRRKTDRSSKLDIEA
ncbi:hypothetical protein [Pseudomaricurvus sp.]|uniref:hypothetical protein n=1 Tax=Pseudomaricurvus sp. TaxID=2004510 RepID=UPI003F6A89BD